jgi:hypothetical protein
VKRNEVVEAGAVAECHASPPCENCRNLSEVIVDAIIPRITESIARMFDAEAVKYGEKADKAGRLTVDGAGYLRDQYLVESMAQTVREWKPE